MNKYLLVALGGAAGASLRYLLTGVTYRFVSESFPWGTFVVNLSGCFVIGFLWALSERAIIPARLHPLVFTGVLGGFTTFSSFGLETFNLLRDGEYRFGLLNILGSTVLGLVLVVAGYFVAQFFLNLSKSGSPS